MCQDIVDLCHPWSSLRLVVPGGVEPQPSERRSVDGDDLDVQAVDEHPDAPTLVRGADADVVDAASVADGDRAFLSTFPCISLRWPTSKTAPVGRALEPVAAPQLEQPAGAHVVDLGQPLDGPACPQMRFDQEPAQVHAEGEDGLRDRSRLPESHANV